MSDSGDTVHLSPSLGPLGIAFLCFSALSPVVSVYIFGAGVIHGGGTGAIAALLIGGTIAAVLGLLYGEIGSAFPNAGGVYPAFVVVLGPFAAFPYIAMMLMIAPATLAFSLLGFADNVRALDPALPILPIALACLAAAALIAILSIRVGARITGLFLGIELIALLVITIVAGLHPARAFAPALLHPVTVSGDRLVPLPFPMFALAIVAAVFTCGGANWATYFAQEMVDAERRIGRVISWISPLAALAIAGPLMLALIAAPDIKAMLSSDAPIATFLQQTVSPAVATGINFGVLLAIFNAVVATIMGYGRLIYATGRDNMWPRAIGGVLSRLDARFQSPLNATLALAACAAALLLLSERILLVLVSNELIVEYLLLALVVLIGRRRGLTGAHYRTPLHPLIPLLAIGVAGAMVVADWLDPVDGRPSLYVVSAVLLGSMAYRFAKGPLEPSTVEPPAASE